MGSLAAVSDVIRQLRPESADSASDIDLLERYACRQDQAAFAALVNRYGCLVYAVARRQLSDRQHAEDVFQGTFLALARAAGRLRRKATLANWLYTVTLRQVRRLRDRGQRQAAIESARPQPTRTSADPLDTITGRELLQVIDEEIARLPERYRLPVLLCCVRGLSREEAAHELGWTTGAVKGRLERGRRRLAARLTARGLAPASLLLAPIATVTVPAELLARTAVLASAPWAPTVPPSLAALASLTPPRHLLLVAACLFGAVSMGLAGWTLAGKGKDAQMATKATPIFTLGPRLSPAVAKVADPNDEPLPDGSTARFGSVRYRHLATIDYLAVSDDGKQAVAMSESRLTNLLVRASYSLFTDGSLPNVRPEMELVAKDH